MNTHTQSPAVSHPRNPSAGPGAAVDREAPASPAAVPSQSLWLRLIRKIVGPATTVEAQTELLCRKMFAGWDPVDLDGHHWPGFSDDEKHYWRAHFRQEAERMIAEGEL